MILKNLNNLSIKRKISLLFAVFIIFNFLIIYFVIKPSINEIENLKEEIISQKIDFINSKEQEKNSDAINKKISAVEPKMKEYQEYYINKNDELGFITTLERAASKNNVLQKIDFQFIKKDGDDGSDKERIIPLELTAVGSYENILKYISEIESLNYFIAIKGVELSSQIPAGNAMMKAESEDGGGEAEQTIKKISLKIKADTYFNEL